ncbi:hypothetical protein NW069_00065 [Mycoplasmopsis cynos]|uniref:hypothetical protein n=1 Tax=Mycoplasmopsis cynos TaxID=171284 RepID=UPI0022042B15|nr:hypothetical protein [Mycoplasmopsis cynos]UWV80622.1 hypothetical protein NW069_00065 [Mycoplasmopsis cynos]
MFPKYLNSILNKFPNYIWTKDQLILDIASNEVIIDFVKISDRFLNLTTMIMGVFLI